MPLVILDLERVKDLISDKIVFTLKTDADKLYFYQTPNLLTIYVRMKNCTEMSAHLHTDYYYTMDFSHLLVQQTIYVKQSSLHNYCRPNVLSLLHNIT